MTATSVSLPKRADFITQCLIDGAWVASDSGRTFSVTNPATDEVIAEIPECGASETRRAIEAAHRALPAWRDRPGHERANLLLQWAALMHRDKERLARIMTLEQGKPINESRGEIVYSASFYEWFAGAARRLEGESIPASVPDKRLLVLPRAIGVCAAITPWNFPSGMIARKAGAALAAGCTIVFKPAEQTPLSAFAMGELALEAGIPKGVMNLITGAPEPIADEMLTNPLVRKLSFTGSTEVGRILMAKAAKNITRLSLELGGHAPFIVFADADLELAADGIIASKFRNAGRTCVCANRIFIEESIRERLTSMVVERAKKLVVGDGLDEKTQIGPLIDDAGVEKALAHIDDAKRSGATVLCGGGLADVPNRARRFVAPTVLANARPDMLCCREETFGPVAPILSFREEREVIDLANGTPYGLAGYFYTRDASRIVRLWDALDFGILGVNDALPSVAQAPFGGMKQSGFGKEGGREGIEEYLVKKYVSWRV